MGSRRLYGHTSRGYHTATMLANGEVLVAGGENGNGCLSSAELYNPATGTWTATGTMSVVRSEHTATLLPGGEVLIAGGHGSSFPSSAERYSPATGTWTATSAMGTVRSFYTATLLANGKVLVVGGNKNPSKSGNNLSSAELYDPATGTWTATGAMSYSRSGHTATLLTDGKALVAGGYTGASELYDAATETWTTTAEMIAPRSYHTATLLVNGKVLVAGSYINYLGQVYPSASTELYKNTPAITLGDSLHGVVTGYNSSYSPGTTAILTATPDPGYVFSEWTGDSSGETNPLSILMDSDKTITAVFGPDGRDPDGDGLTNYQELVVYGTDPTLRDTDGDGFLDGYEVQTGKSPLNPLDKPALVAEARTAIEFTFPAALGKTYRIEDSPDLTAWTTVESGIAGNGAVIQRFYTTRGMQMRYFRVEEDAPQ